MAERMLCVDPGLIGTGLALFDGDTLVRAYSVSPVQKGRLEWRLAVLRAQVHGVLDGWGISTESRVYAAMEMPTFQDTPKGHASARTGNLEKLCMAAGVVMSLLGPLTDDDVALVYPIQWKGNRSKDYTMRTVRRALTTTELHLLDGLPDHAWDAVGIGLWLMEG